MKLIITENQFKQLINENKYIAYHSTNEDFNDFDLNKTSQGVIWFTDSLDQIKNKNTGASGYKNILKREITLNNPAGWEEYEKYSIGELINMKYDGVILPEDGYNDFIVFYTNSIKKVNESINEMAYPTQFNMNTFKNMRSFRQRIEYCEQNLKKISGGSGRIVYQIDNDKALKLAKNAKGIAQNEAEADMSSDYFNITAKVFDTDENYTFIEMELAKKITPSIFKNIMGFDFSLVYDYLFNIFENGKLPPEILNSLESLNENEFIIDIMEFVGNYQLPIGDFYKINSFGLVNRNGENKIVIIDYGLTNEVFNKHYRR